MIRFRPELRVLFVCTANVCRSPLAEGLLRHRLRAMGLAGRVQVRSAGVCVGQRGRRADPRVERMAAEAGVSLARIRSRMLTPRMIRSSDYVLVMEREHLEDVRRLCPEFPVGGGAFPGAALADTTSPNVQLLGSFLPFRDEDEHVKDIPDPYFGDLQSVADVHELIDAALTGFLACLEARLGEPRYSQG